MRALVLALLVASCATPVDEPASSPRFWFSEDKAWEVQHHPEGKPGLELVRACEYKPPFRSPRSIALVADHSYEEFLFDVIMRSTHEPYGHLDLCLFFGFQDPAHYYYVHLATAPDEHAHNIFLVNGAARKRIAEIPARGVDWGTHDSHAISLQRGADGSIRVVFDGEEVLSAIDTTFMRGHVGLGSFDDTGEFFWESIEGQPLAPLLTADPFEREY